MIWRRQKITVGPTKPRDDEANDPAKAAPIRGSQPDQGAYAPQNQGGPEWLVMHSKDDPLRRPDSDLLFTQFWAKIRVLAAPSS
jgi:hypothetical protein